MKQQEQINAELSLEDLENVTGGASDTATLASAGVVAGGVAYGANALKKAPAHAPAHAPMAEKPAANAAAATGHSASHYINQGANFFKNALHR